MAEMKWKSAKADGSDFLEMLSVRLAEKSTL